MIDRRSARLATSLAAMLAMTAMVPSGVLADEALRDRIATETAELRGLPPLDEIDDALITTDELKAMLPDLLSTDYTPEQAAADERGLIAIGLVPQGTDLMALYERLLGEQVAGFYDPETNEMYVISDSGDFDGMEQVTYAHETVHALQDAHLGLDDTMGDMGGGNADRDTAVSALVEGDASSAAFDFLAQHPDIARDLVFSAAPPSAELDSAPPAVSVSLMFPYIVGETFVQALRDEGGWEAVDAAYADLPQSTEQIMHPEKYLAGEEPVAVEVPDLSAALGDGWEFVVDDTMGEFGVALLLADLEPGDGVNPFTGGIDLPIPAMNAAAGWGGDRYALWANGDAETLVWQSTWDTERDAQAFLRAVAQHQQTRFGGLFEGEAGDDVAMIADGVAVRLLLDGATVTMVQAPDLATADAALAGLREDAS